MKSRIIKLFQVWRSNANGYVFSVRGISPTLVCGQHAAVQPKVLVKQWK